MKNLLIGVVAMLILHGTTEAQAKQNKAGTKKAVVVKKKPASASTSTQAKKTIANAKNNRNTVILQSVGNYNARTNAIANFTVTDPYVNTLNAKAKGIEPNIKNAYLYGMPKGAYGFANGRLRVFPTGTTSSGTITGIGGVATGSSTGAMGGTGLSMTNGKNPYAGTAMWGNSRGLITLKTDSTVRQ